MTQKTKNDEDAVGGAGEAYKQLWKAGIAN